MTNSYQRLFIIGFLAVSIVISAILIGAPSNNPSVATSALADNGEEMLIPYYSSPDTLPTAEAPSENYTILFFSAAWDSYSASLSGTLRGKLAVYNNLQIIELEINDYRALAEMWKVTQPPAVILLNKQGVELGRITSAATAELEKLFSQLPRN